MAFSTDSTNSVQGLSSPFNNATSCASKAATAANGGACVDKYAKYVCTKNGKRVKTRDACRKVKVGCPCNN